LPAQADAAIVGSGPTGAAYARILSEESPSLRGAVFEARPQIANEYAGRREPCRERYQVRRQHTLLHSLEARSAAHVEGKGK
jgi:cation diffusion facilitator CzcD-associated flavoprotein CzcO